MRNIPTQSGSLSSEKRKLLELRLKQKGISIPETQVIPKRKTLGPCPLSFAQQRLWFLDQLELGSTAYLIPHALRFQGDLSIETLERSLEELVRRHESLRTTFVMQLGQPVQVIHAARGWILPVIDLQGIRQEQRGEVARWLAEQEAQHPCDLVVGPLLRTYLLQLETQEYVVLLTLHHIITDGWSDEILVRELTTFYHSFIDGQPSPLAPLPIQYADYALWQREWLQGEVLEAQLAYWRTQLVGVLPLALPTDHPRPAMQSHRGALQVLQLPQAISQQLIALSRQEDVTLFMLLLAALQVLLHRYTGQGDISVGTPIANRSHRELEELIGFFVNTLVMRTDLSGNLTFLEVLTNVRHICLEAYAHQDIPFEKVVEDLEPERNLSHSPLFQMMLVLQNGAGKQEALSGIRVEPLAVESVTSKFDLTLSIGETEQGLRCSLEYNSDLFEAETITRMLGHWQTLLEGVVHNPLARLSDLPLLTEDEREQLLVEWNATQRDYPQDMCIHQLFEQQVEHTPEAVALVCEDEALTYRELNRQANQLAHYLQDLGVGPEVLVGICMQRSLEMIVGLLAVLKAGGAYVPLDPASSNERLSLILEDIEALVILTQEHLRELFLEQEISLVCLDTDWKMIEEKNSLNLACGASPENLAYVIFTSGSTGRPKGVLVTHVNVMHSTLARFSYYRKPVSNYLLLSPLFFDSCVAGLYWTLCQGGKLVLAPEDFHQDLGHLPQFIAQHSISHLLSIPLLYTLILNQAQSNHLASLSTVIVAGENCPIGLVQRHREVMPQATLCNEYGPTEATVWSSVYCDQCEHLVAHVPIGRPIANVEMYLLDQALCPVPIGVAGELYIGGSGVARGYLRDAKLTTEKFVPHPYAEKSGERLYRTGDLARYLPDGTIEFLGRIDQQVKLRGHRIELGEIEAVLGQHPAIQGAVVLSREDVSAEKHLVAYTTVHQGQRLTVSDLRSYLQDRLPSYIIPSAFVALDALPLTSNGKVDRRALPALEVAHQGENGAEEGARTPIEELLVEIWGEVLGRREVGINENFFELGGHSLLATRLIARVRATLGVEVPLRAVFETPAVAGFAQRVEQALRKGEGMDVPPLVVRERPEEIPLSFAQQRLWFLDQLEPGNTAYLLPCAHHLPGPLNTEALERSLQKMIHRHESLCTTFAAHRGQPVQVIHPVAHYCLPVVDLCGLEPEKRKREARKLAKQEAQYPCDLERGPLLRTSLLHLDGEEHILLLTLHHIVTDGWSDRVLMRELVTLYRAFVVGQPSPLAPLPIQYADYALWQREWLQGEVLEAQLDYWTRRLGGVSPIELPADYPRPSVASPRGATHSFALSADLSQALGALSRQEGMTLFMVLLAAFQVLFYRYTGQSDIVIGTDSANRNRVETEGIIGFFINVLLLRTDLSGRPSFREVLKQVREIVLGAYTHQETPFELLVEKLAPDHYLDRTPLVQVLFVLQNIPVELADAGPPREPEALDQSSLCPVMDEETMVKFDLALFMLERAGRLSGALNYRLDLFKASTIATMTTRFEILLQSIVKQPDAPIDLLEMTSDTERAQQEWKEQELWHELRIGDDGWFDLSEIDFAEHSSSE